jgi:hypothetical protein
VFYDSLGNRPPPSTGEYRKREEPFYCTVKLHADSIIEKLNARILYTGAEKDPSSVTLEITSERDLFYCYRYVCNDEYAFTTDFKKLNGDVTKEFKDLPQLLKDIIKQVGTNDKSGIGRTIAVMDMAAGKEGEALLTFK